MASKFYRVGYIGKSILDSHSSEKAFYSTYTIDGFSKFRYVWIPKSICIFSEPNDVGNVQVMVPMWWFDKNLIREHNRLIDICWTGVKEI